MYIKKYSEILAFYLLLIPILNLFIYYFKIEFVKFFLVKYFTVILLLIFLIGILKILLQLKKTSWINIIVVCLILICPILESAFRVNSINVKAFSSHFIGALIFVTFFVFGKSGIIDISKIMHNKRFQNLLILFSTISLFFFLLNPFNYNYYKSMQSYYLVPSFVFFLVNKKHRYTIIFALLIFLHFKRAVIFTMVIITFLYMIMHLNFKVRHIGKILGCIAILFLLYFLLPEDLIYNINSRFEKGINTITGLFSFNGSTNLDSSSGEKIQEIRTAGKKLLQNINQVFFGNGFGWEYELENGTKRYYTHIAPFYLFLTSGILSLILYIYFIYCSIFYVIKPYHDKYFLGILSLFFLLLSFSTMDYFVTFLPALTLGSIYMHFKKETIR